MPERPLLDIAKVEISDDLGRARTVPFLDLIGPPRGYPNTPDPATLRRLRWGIFRRNLAGGLALGFTVSVAVSAVFLGLLFLPGLTAPRFLMLSAVVLLPLAVLYELLALPIFRRMYRPAYLEAALAQHLCPFCLYDLARAEPTADDRIVCPECSASWNAVRFATPPATGSPRTPPGEPGR